MQTCISKMTLCTLLLAFAGPVCAYIVSPKILSGTRFSASLTQMKSSLSLRQARVGRQTAVRMAVAQGGMDQIVNIKMPTSVTKSWEVHKFGGASLADAGLYRTVGDLLVSESKGRGDGTVPTMAIVSAMSGTTDQLIGVVNAALKDPAEAKKLLDVAVDKQINTLKELAGPEIVGPIERNIRKDAEDIMGVLQALKLLRTIPAVTLELITGFGEVQSCSPLTDRPVRALFPQLCTASSLSLLECALGHLHCTTQTQCRLFVPLGSRDLQGCFLATHLFYAARAFTHSSAARGRARAAPARNASARGHIANSGANAPFEPARRCGRHRRSTGT